MQEGTEPAAKACVGDAGTRVEGTKKTFKWWPEGAEGATQDTETQRVLP